MRRRPPRHLRGIIYLSEYRDKNWRKHHVIDKEVVEVLGGAAIFRFQEKGLHRGEDVYAAYGQTTGSRYLIVFFVHKLSGEALILSARDMTTTERRYYETHKKYRLHKS